MTDKDYIYGFASNDDNTIKRFYNEYRGSFCSYFKKNYNKDEAYVADLFQESCIVLYKNVRSGKLSSHNLTSSLKTYLFNVGKYSLMARDRNEKMKQTTSFEGGMNVDDVGNVYMSKEIMNGLDAIRREEIYNIEKNDYEELVERMVADMKPPCSEILELFYWYNKSMEDIALRMNYGNADSAKNQKCKCMKKLKAMMVMARKHNVYNR